LFKIKQKSSAFRRKTDSKKPEKRRWKMGRGRGRGEGTEEGELGRKQQGGGGRQEGGGSRDEEEPGSGRDAS
jgi:hypothetical protein